MFSKKRIFTVSVFLLVMLFLFTGCKMGVQKDNEDKEIPKKELVVYCGITMVKPISEIAKVVEQEKKCSVKIVKDASGTLLRMIESNNKGDLFLPGADSFINEAEKKGLILEKALVGYNQAALIVAKGNPLHLTNDPIQLLDKKYKVVLANPALGSIGREAEKVLERRGIKMDSLKDIVYFTNDSKDTMKAVIDKEADLTINWYATALWSENAEKVDAIKMDEKYAPKDKLVLAVLNISQNKEEAEYFFNYAKSEAGKKIFERYGFL